MTTGTSSAARDGCCGDSSPSRFACAATTEQLVYQLVGAGSTCWVGGTGDAVFDDAAARELAEAGLARLAQLQAAGR